MTKYVFEPFWNEDRELPIEIIAANPIKAEKQAEAEYLNRLTEEEKTRRGKFVSATYTNWVGDTKYQMLVHFENDKNEN